MNIVEKVSSGREDGELKTETCDYLQSPYLDLKEAAGYLKLSVSSMQKISAARLIPVYKPRNGKVYFLKLDLVKYIENGRKKSLAELKQEGTDDLFNKKGGNYGKH